MYYDQPRIPTEQDFVSIEGGAALALLAIEHEQHASQLLKLNKALLQAGESIIVTGLDGTIEYVNEAFTKTTGYSLDEAVGNNPRMLHSGKQSAEFYQRMWTTLLATGQWKGDIWNRRKNGELYPERLQIRSMLDEAGNITSYVGTFSDISEQVAMEKAFRETQKMEALGTLVGGVAHNFNNILAGITGKLYLARRKAAAPEIDKYLLSISELSQRAADIIAQLMAFSHQGHSDASDFDLVTAAREACETARLGVPEDIHFIGNFCDEKLFVHGNDRQLQQVLMNLVNNARDAMQRDKPRCIEVSVKSCMPGKSCHLEGDLCSVDKRVACLKVEDTGKGMDEKTAGKIFDPFFTTKEVGQGTGLGLSMSIGTIQQFGGDISVKTSPGKGSVFRVYLPLVPQPVEASDATAIVVEKVASDALVLVVDDEEIVRETTSEILTDFGYRVVTAEDGKQALALFLERPDEFSMLFSDLVMPNMDGCELAQEIRKVSPALPVIFASGYDMKLLDIDLKGIEDAKFVTKPFDIVALNSLMSAMLLVPAK